MRAILSIKSIYATAIYQGLKTVEVRKTSIRFSERIYLYETAPKRQVTGYIQIEYPQRLPIDTIIRDYLPFTLLDEKSLRTYAGDKTHLYIWPIIHAERIEPKRLLIRAPQSYIYVREGAIQ